MNNKELSSQLKTLQFNYKTCKSMFEEIKSIEIESKQKILEGNKFFNEDGEIIINYQNCYDIEPYLEFLRFQNLVSEEIKKDKWYKSSSFEINKSLLDIEEKLINFSIEYLTTKGKISIVEFIKKGRKIEKYRQIIIDLTLKLDI